MFIRTSEDYFDRFKFVPCLDLAPRTVMVSQKTADLLAAGGSMKSIQMRIEPALNDHVIGVSTDIADIIVQISQEKVHLN